MNDNAKKLEPQKLQKVTLKQPHKHAGKQYAKGASIDVNEADVAWLANKGVIDKPPATSKP